MTGLNGKAPAGDMRMLKRQVDMSRQDIRDLLLGAEQAGYKAAQDPYSTEGVLIKLPNGHIASCMCASSALRFLASRGDQ